MVYTLTIWLIAYVTLVTVAVLIAWLHIENKHNTEYQAERTYTIYFCIPCNNLYTDHMQAESHACSRCGKMNLRLQF